MYVLIYDSEKRKPTPIRVGKARADKLLAKGRYKLWQEDISGIEIVKPKKKEAVVEAEQKEDINIELEELDKPEKKKKSKKKK